MLNLFSSPKRRQEQRMLKLCLNSEKPVALIALNRLDRPAGLAQPVAKFDDADPAVLNVMRRQTDPAAGASGLTLTLSRKKRR